MISPEQKRSKEITNIDEVKFMVAQAEQYIDQKLQRNPGQETWISAFRNLVVAIEGHTGSALEDGEISEKEKVST